MEWKKNRLTVYEDDFLLSIYDEHIEESSFLYEQLKSLIDEDAIPWVDLDQFIENRLEAHIDGLFLGSDLAVMLLQKRAGEGDFGELHAAVRVFCRKGRIDLVDEVIHGLDYDDEERVRAVCDALCFEPCDGFQEALLNSLFEMGGDHLIIAASIIGFKRVSLEKRLLGALKDYPSDQKITPALLEAISKLRPSNVGGEISPILKDENEMVVHAAIHALVRMGEEGFTRTVPFKNWPVITHGLCGGAATFTDKPHIESKEKALAMGLIGEISAIPLLMEALRNETFAEFASIALNLITGADLMESHFIPEPMDEDMLFEDEIERFKKGELFKEGEVPGETIHRISQNPDMWRHWWQAQKGEFKNRVRYRHGRLYSPQCLIETLKSEKSLNLVRSLAYEELVIRYGIDFPFDIHMPVEDQLKIIGLFEQRIKDNPDHFEEGVWTYNGRVIHSLGLPT